MWQHLATRSACQAAGRPAAHPLFYTATPTHQQDMKEAVAGHVYHGRSIKPQRAMRTNPACRPEPPQELPQPQALRQPPNTAVARPKLAMARPPATQLELLQRAAARAQQQRHVPARPASSIEVPKRTIPHAKSGHSSHASKINPPPQDFCASDSSNTSFGSCASGTTWPPETRRAPVVRLQQLQYQQQLQQQQQQQRPFALPSLNSIATSRAQFPSQTSEMPDNGSSKSALNSLAGLSGMIVDSNMAYYPLPAWQPALPLPGMGYTQHSQQRHLAAGGSPANSGESAGMSTSSRHHLPGSPCSWPAHQPVLSPNPLGFAGGFNVPGFPGFVPQ